MFDIMKTEWESGQITTFEPEQFYPLNSNQFIEAHNGKTNLYEIKALATNINIFEPGKEPKHLDRGTATLKIDFNHALPVYALVDGGWLPPPLVEPPIFLLDRNVVGHIQQIVKGNARYADHEWWLKLIDDERAVISPFLFAFESDKQMIPSRDDFVRCYTQGAAIIQTLFPKANIMVYNDAQYDAAMQTIDDVLKRHHEEVEFLKKVQPLVVQNNPPDKLEAICNNIIKIAEELGLPLRSLPLLAALSCLYEDGNSTGFNAAREVLKLKGGSYTDERAYNVLCDLRGLLLTLAFKATSNSCGQPAMSYVTADKPALLFACGLDFRNVEFKDNNLVITMELSEFLFPKMSKNEREALAKRIEIS